MRIWNIIKNKINRTNVTELKNIGKYLFKSRCKWENTVRKVISSFCILLCVEVLLAIYKIFMDSQSHNLITAGHNSQHTQLNNILPLNATCYIFYVPVPRINTLQLHILPLNATCYTFYVPAPCMNTSELHILPLNATCYTFHVPVPCINTSEQHILPLNAHTPRTGTTH
jgi:hypothetical protein